MPTLSPSSVSPPTDPNQRDPAFAGAYGYRALGAYSSGLGTDGNKSFQPQTDPNAGVAPSPSSPNLTTQQLSQAGKVWDAQQQTWKTGNPNFVIDAAQGAAVNDAQRFDKVLGIGESPATTTLRVDKQTHQAVNKLVSGDTVICTELMRRGDASARDLIMEYRFVSKLPLFVFKGYRVWAVPYVVQMRKSPALYAATRPFAKAFMQESAALLGLRPHSVLGMIVIGVGLPICALLGIPSLLVPQPCEA